MSELQAGQVLLIANAGALEPLVVTAEEDGRVLAKTRDDEERSLALKRVFWCSTYVVSQAETLTSYWDSIQAISQSIALEDAWSQLPPGQRGDVIDGDALLEVLGLAVTVQTQDALALAVFRNSLFFKLRQRQIVVSSDENVRSSIAKIEQKN